MAIAGIVAGGTGSRMGSTVPKQFLPLCGRPVIVRTIEKFIGSEGIDAVIVGVNPDWYDHMQSLISEYFPAGVYAARGGADRSDTIVNIIRYAIDDLGYDEDEILLTHDAVRPFVTEKMISDSIDAMSHCEICTAAVGATDTMLISEHGTLPFDAFGCAAGQKGRDNRCVLRLSPSGRQGMYYRGQRK